MNATKPRRDNWLLGNDSTPGEKSLVAAVCLAAIAAFLVTDDAWQTWHWAVLALVLFLTVDIVGGVAANGLDSATRLYGATSSRGRLDAALKNPLIFSAFHVHPFVVAWAVPGGTFWWAAFWYTSCLLGTFAVQRAGSLTFPLAASWTAVSIMIATALSGPEATAWFGPALCLKLVLCHATTPHRARTAPQPSTL